MIVHKIFAPVKKMLPRGIAAAIRSFFTAVITPLYFSFLSGHFKSSLRSKAVDKNGAPLPWYTYPAIDFLACKDFSDKIVLEFGAGQSTLWWADRAKMVVSFESDRDWYSCLKRQVPGNVKLYFIPDDLSGFDNHIGSELFDIVVVDGLDRFKASKIASDLIKSDGAVIVDNSEGFWGPEGTYPIIDHLREKRFSRIDFYGHAPGVILPHCTSLFFRDHCFLLEGRENPLRKAS